MTLSLVYLLIAVNLEEQFSKSNCDNKNVTLPEHASIRTAILEATALKQRRHYAAAKHLLKTKLVQYPHHAELNALYQRIEMLQQVKIHRRHQTHSA